MKLLLDEMYGAALARALREKNTSAVTVAELRLTGRPDIDVLTAAVDGGFAVLTENVSDFARISGQHVASGLHHHGVLIALSSRFSRRPCGYAAIVTAVEALSAEPLNDRLLYLESPGLR